MKKPKNKTLAKLAMLIPMGFGIVPVDSISSNGLPITHTEQIIYEPVADELIVMPIEEATIQMNKLVERMMGYSKGVRKEWEQGGFAPIDIKKYKLGNKLHYYADLHITRMTQVLEAVKKTLKENTHYTTQEKENLIAFGRSVSLYMTTIESILSFIEQTHPPKKTTSAALNVTDEEVKELIRSEHKKLGLGKPSFDVAKAHG